MNSLFTTLESKLSRFGNPLRVRLIGTWYKGSDISLLREMISFAAERLMALESDALCGAFSAEVWRHDIYSTALLKVTLNDVKPAVQRRLTLPIAIRLKSLAPSLAGSPGWTNSLLSSGPSMCAGATGPRFGDGLLDFRKARLIDVLEDVGAKTMLETAAADGFCIHNYHTILPVQVL